MKKLNIDKKWIRIPLKILLWVFVGLLSLLIIVVIALQLPVVQNFAAQKAVSYLKTKVNPNITLESVSIGFPKTVNIKGLYIPDVNNDTLLFAKEVNVGVNMFGLLKNKLNFNSVSLDGITARVIRMYPDTAYNFSYIPEAFASDTTSDTVTGESSSFEITFGNISLNDIRLLYIDTIAGVNARVYIGEFNTGFDDFNLNKMVFKVDEIELLNSSVSLYQTPPLEKSSDTTSSQMPDLGVKRILFDNLSVNYTDPAAGNELSAMLGRLETNIDTFNLVNQHFAIDIFTLANSQIKFTQTKPQQFDTIVAEVVQKQGIEKQTATPEWIFTLKELRLTDNNLMVVNYDSVPKTNGIDFNNLLVSDFNLQADDLYVTPGLIKLSLNELNLKEKSGFSLTEFSSRISYDTTNITLADLNIVTPHTRIADHIEANFSSIAALTDSLEKVVLNISIENSSIGATDVLYFMPDLAKNPQLNLRPSEAIMIDGNITGTLADLSITDLLIRNNRSTSIAVNGNIKNLLDTERLYASVDRFRFKTTRSDLFSYIQRSTIPDNISVPENVDVSGGFIGYIRNFNSNVNLRSSYGNIFANVKMNPSKGNIETNYRAEVKVEDFDLGKLMMQPDTLGVVNLTFNANGIGFSPDSMSAEVKASVHDAFYNQYVYRDLNLEGYINNRSFHGELWIDDENLAFNYTGYVNVNPDSLALLFDLNLERANLKALNLSEDEFNVKGAISSDLAKRFGPNPLGTIKIHGVEIEKNNLNCPVDSIIIESAYDYDSSYIKLRSSFLNASFTGQIYVQELAGTISYFLNRYYQLSPDSMDVEHYAQHKPQHFDFRITMQDPNTICENLIPNLNRFEPLALSGTFNSEDNKLMARADIPMIDYSGIFIDSLSFIVDTDNEKLDYHFHVTEISNNTFALERFDLHGDISDNKIAYNLSAYKADTFNVLQTGGLFTKYADRYTLIMREPIVLNNTAWHLDPDNIITFSDEGLDAQRVILSGEDQVVSILTQPGDYVPLQIKFEQFRLSNLSQIVEKEKELVRGLLNGNFTLLNVNGVSAFTSDLKIDSLQFMEMPVGNLLLLADNSVSPERFDVKLELSGYDNGLTIDGYYSASDSVGVLNLDTDIQRLNMSTIESFTFGQISRASGYLNGEVALRGTTDDPSITGQLVFNDVAFNAPYANTYLRMSNNTIDIRDRRLTLNDITLIDTLNNTAVIGGNIDFANLQSPQFDIRVNSNNFLALNSARGNGGLPVYGKAIIDSDIHVTGTPASPVIDMRVRLNNGTSVTYVMPESQMSLNQHEGIVIFTDSLVSSGKYAISDTAIRTVSNVEGITLRASISFQPDAILKMLVDPVAGDSLYVSGDGTLNFTLNPGGQMNLTGRYDINDGGYNITLNEFIRRRFNISEGSYITWNGDIMDANVDLTAIYRVRTSPMILVQDQIEGMDESTIGGSRNLLTFLVYLKMEGELTKPQISFDIDQPEDEKGALGGIVNARLNELKTDESQLNKQVFALLTLNRFLGQDPFETGNAPLTVESATRTSASKLLTQQFSALSEKYIKGVDLDIGVNSFEDYSSGTEEGRTQLQIGVSKQFLNDRVSVQVGGNVELEGERARNNNASEIAGNVNVEYKLTPNGRYRLKGFRRIEYENPIEGELINTGVGIIYSRDFRRLRQLFTSEKKLRELREKRNEQLSNQNQSTDEND